MKAIYPKDENETHFISNSSGQPEIVLIFPVTRDVSRNPLKWKKVLDFFVESEIKTLVVIDKTDKSSATEYFFNHFQVDNKQLLVFPRSINQTLFDTLGEIVLDENMWVIQLHDDDDWSGRITLPANPDWQTVYFGDFYLLSESNGLTKFLDFSMPNRIVFTLVPSFIWNRFTNLIQAQRFHVPGSFDFTLSLMARLVCNFEYSPGFSYVWKDDNWSSRRKSRSQLIGLAQRDGWENWASPEIAIFNRSVDSLVAVNFVIDLLDSQSQNSEIVRSIEAFQPSRRKRGVYLFFILILVFQSLFRKSVGVIFKKENMSGTLDERVELHRFIMKTWSIKSIRDLIRLIDELESNNRFQTLNKRFLFWRYVLNQIEQGVIRG